jgi:hypothetical protein
MIPYFFITLLLLMLLEVFATTLFPFLGVSTYRLRVDILIILFLSFRLESPFIAILIFMVQYVHSFFSIDLWALGTFTGILVSVVSSYLRSMLQFSSAVITVFLVQLFQILWFLIESLVIYIRFDNWHYVIDKFWRFIPESLVISCLAPFFFILLEKVWKFSDRNLLGDEG